MSTPVAVSSQPGYSPFPGHDSLNSSGLTNNSSGSGGKRVCLMFGSSITTRVEEDRMSKGSRVVVNLSKSGAKICDLHKYANDFCLGNADIVSNVDKIIVNIGTNDVKWFNGCRFSVFKRFKVPLLNLVKDLKFRFPLANISFITMLPIRALYNYTAETVNQFNLLLLEVCKMTGCEFFDCFGDFLDVDLRDYNYSLFRDKWHLNEHGLKLLCRALKYIIFGNTFRSHMRTYWRRPFYS